MSIYSKLKDHLPEMKSVISDDEFLLLHRRDFHMTQISAVHASMGSIGAKLGYPYRVLMGLMDSIVAGLRDTKMNIILADPTLTLAAYQCWLRAGGGGDRVITYAPRGLATMPKSTALIQELIDDFVATTNLDPAGKPLEERKGLFTLVIGNTKQSEQTLFAVDRFVEAERGMLVLKDYARVDACDEREYLESKQVFPTITFEGHALAFKL